MVKVAARCRRVPPAQPLQRQPSERQPVQRQPGQRVIGAAGIFDAIFIATSTALHHCILNDPGKLMNS